MIPPHIIRIVGYYALREGAKLAQKGAEMAKEAYDDYQYRQPRSIAILGPRSSGKTSLYVALGADMPISPTTEKFYEMFSFKTSKGTVNISYGWDYGGDLRRGEQSSRIAKSHGTGNYIDDKISLSTVIGGKDSVIFLFDVNKYIDDDNYSDSVNRLLAAVINYISENSNLDKLSVYATHGDQIIISRDSALKCITQKSRNSICEMFLGKNLDIINVHEKASIDKIKEEVFKHPK